MKKMQPTKQTEHSKVLGVCVCVTVCVYASGHKLNCDTYKVDDLGNKYI